MQNLLQAEDMASRIQRTGTLGLWVAVFALVGALIPLLTPSLFADDPKNRLMFVFILMFSTLIACGLMLAVVGARTDPVNAFEDKLRVQAILFVAGFILASTFGAGVVLWLASVNAFDSWTIDTVTPSVGTHSLLWGSIITALSAATGTYLWKQLTPAAP